MSAQNNPQYASGTRYDAELIGMLQYIFITLRKHDIGRLASELNMEYADLYAFVTGRRTMPITLLRKITEITKDKIFLDTVFAGSAIHWDFRANTRAHSNDPVVESFEMVTAVGAVCEQVKNSLIDGRLDPSKRHDIMARITYAAQELNDLLEVVKAVKTSTGEGAK